MTTVPLVYYRPDTKQRIILGSADVNEKTGEVQTTTLLPAYNWTLDDPEVRDASTFRLTWGAAGVTEAVLVYHPTAAVANGDLLKSRRVDLLTDEELDLRFGFFRQSDFNGMMDDREVGHETITRHFVALYRKIADYTMKGRATEIALKELETAAMWAHKALEENGKF